MTQVSFRCPADLKKKAEQAAKRQDIDATEWWRRAGLNALKNGNSSGR